MKIYASSFRESQQLCFADRLDILAHNGSSRRVCKVYSMPMEPCLRAHMMFQELTLASPPHLVASLALAGLLLAFWERVRDLRAQQESSHIHPCSAGALLTRPTPEVTQEVGPTAAKYRLSPRQMSSRIPQV